MSYDIIALDVDGTLTNSEKRITERTLKALVEAEKQGKKIILASGRHQFGLKGIAEQLELSKYGGYIMAFNGGKIFDAKTGDLISATYYPRNYIKPIIDEISQSNITAITYEGDTIITNDKVNEYTDIEAKILGMKSKKVDNFTDYITFDINKILLVGDPALLDGYKQRLIEKYKGYVDVFKSCPFFLEVMPFGINKGACLSKLLTQIGYSRDQLIACGDSYNDMTMIGYAGLGVCMENGEPDVKKIANVIADTNDNDGIAKIVEKYMLKSKENIA